MRAANGRIGYVTGDETGTIVHVHYAADGSRMEENWWHHVADGKYDRPDMDEECPWDIVSDA